MKKKILVRSVAAFICVCFSLNGLCQESGWRIPSWADTMQMPFAVTSAVLKNGKNTYAIYCITCHGKNGDGQGAPGMTFEVKPANFHDMGIMRQKDATLFWKVTRGYGGMPSFGTSLTEHQRWQVVSYLREFTKDKNGKPQPAFDNMLPVTGYTVDPSMRSSYFPVPSKVRNVIGSETMQFMVDTVVSGLTLPWSMAFLPDQKTVLIAERSGALVIVREGKKLSEPVQGPVPQSLREVKLHPGFASNHLVYLTYYIEPKKDSARSKTYFGGYAVLMRGKLENDVLSDTQVLYKVGPFKENGFWYGNKLAFDKNGALYMTIGQRTIEHMHRWNTAQDNKVISGKIIRLNDDGTIPKDNPFIDSAGVLPEIYSLGHRMPEGLVYNKRTGQLWENEHGENGGCELNLLGPGKNYGWPKTTFSINYDGTIITTDTVLPGMELPVHYWKSALAPAGMDFVYGAHYPGWDGNLIIGSLVQKRLNRTIMQGDKAVRDEKLIQGIGRVRDVTFGPDEFLYALTEDTGLLVRVLPLKKGKAPVARKKTTTLKS